MRQPRIVLSASDEREPEVPWVVAAAPPTKVDGAIRQLLRSAFSEWFEDPPTAPDPKTMTYVHDSAKLMRRRNAGEISPEDYEGARREIAEHPIVPMMVPPGGYVAIVAMFIAVAIVGVILGRDGDPLCHQRSVQLPSILTSCSTSSTTCFGR